MKKELYKINNNIEKIKKGLNTSFLDINEFRQVTSKLKKGEYKVFYPYRESEKIILYTKDIPKVSLFKIDIDDCSLRHQDIMGSLYALNINNENFGDIVKYNGYFYIYVLASFSEYLKENFTSAGKYKFKLIEVDNNLLKNYKREYEEKEIILSSLRIDNIVSGIINSSRKIALDKIKNKEVFVNCEIITKNSYLIKENDIFSIRKYGKYKFIGIIKGTKKNKYIIKYYKYL